MLGLHAIKEKPVAVDGKVDIRPVSKISGVDFRILMELDDVSCIDI